MKNKVLTTGVLSLLLVGAMTTVRLPIVTASDGTMAGMSTMPTTKDEHMKMAESYKKKAAGYREDAEFHRKMLADYKMGVANLPKSPTENPWIKKERIHCEAYIKQAMKLASQADEFAEFHTMRASEVQ